MRSRLSECNIGHCRFNSSSMPWELKYIKGFERLAAAKQREVSIKSNMSRKYALVIVWLDQLAGIPILIGGTWVLTPASSKNLEE